MKNNFVFNKLFISFFLLAAVLFNMAVCSFNFSVKNISGKDNAILTRFFSSSDMYLKDVSKVLNNNVIVSKKQTSSQGNFECGFCSDVIFTEHFNYVNYMELVSFGLLSLFLFNYLNLIRFNFDMWRCIVFQLIFKMLFNILPRSISIRTLLNTESLCFVC